MMPAPSYEPEGEALEILRRLEPVLLDVQAGQQRQAQELTAIQGDIREIKGELKHVPSMAQLVSLVLAVLAVLAVLVVLTGLAAAINVFF